MPENMKGFLIAIEGIDGAGKSSQIDKIAILLSNYNPPLKVNVFHEPTHESEWGKKIRDEVKKNRNNISPEEELALFVKDRKWDLEHNILPALDRNEVVIVDRYYLSNAAYQGSLGIPLETILEMNSFAPVPDLWIILDVSVTTGQRRLVDRNRGKIDQLEQEEDLKRVRANYAKLATMDIGPVVFIDAEQAEEKVTNILFETILLELKMRDYFSSLLTVP